MATSEEPPLDEIQWRSPPIAQSMGGIQTNTVLPYFSHSPFFDATSNNATLTTQATYNPNMFYLIQTREAFEGRLRSMQGLEFMVTHDPSNNGHQQDNSGVWVIRKQYRRKRQGLDDEITPISSYFVIGENIYMAPSVGNVLGSRMLSTVTSLTKLFSTASALPLFTPSLGHTYFPPVPKPIGSLNSTSTAQTTQTSKESTPMPDTQASQKSSKPPLASSSKISSTNLLGASLLAESFSLSLRYNSEYMDENPLLGEPGSFILQKSRDAPPSQSQSQSQPQSQSQASKDTPSINTSTPGTDSLPPLKTDIPPVGAGMEPTSARKGSKGAEKSPTTPGFRDKKGRKKSRVAVSTPK